MMRPVHAALIGALAVAACDRSESPTAGSTGVGEAVDRSLAKPQVVDLAQLDALLAAKRGKGLLLNFWATW